MKSSNLNAFSGKSGVKAVAVIKVGFLQFRATTGQASPQYDWPSASHIPKRGVGLA